MKKNVAWATMGFAMLFALCVCGAGSSFGSLRHNEHEAWVAKCLDDFKEIKPGMMRAEIEKRMTKDGGLQSYVTVRYVHPECSYFKIDVEYSVKRNPAEQGRVVPSADDKAVKVSKPYIENPHGD